MMIKLLEPFASAVRPFTPLAKVAAPACVSAFLAGCSTTSFMSDTCMGGTSVKGPLGGSLTSQTFSQPCADNLAANKMIESGVPELQILGTTIHANSSPTVKKAVKDVADGKGAPLPTKKTVTCELSAVEPKKPAKNGKKPAFEEFTCTPMT